MIFPQNHQFFIDICLKCAEEIRGKLKTNEKGRLIAGHGHFFVRDYYIYEVLDEIEKAGCWLMQFSEFCGDKKIIETQVNDRINRNVIQSMLDAQSMLKRKLMELLLETALFKSSNQNIYFKHYLLIKELDLIGKRERDFKEFYGIENRNLSFQKNLYEREINNILPILKIERIWYASINKATKKPSNSFNTYQVRFKDNFSSLNSTELLILGGTYSKFSEYSEDIHPGIGNIKTVRPVEIEKNIGHIGLLAKQIIINCKKLLKIRGKDGGMLKQILKLEKVNTVPGELFKKNKINSFRKGDYVIVSGVLARVTEMVKSKYGYVSYKVFFIDKPMITGITEDFFPKISIQLLFKREDILKDIQKKSPTKIGTRKIQQHLDKVILNLWNNAGLKEHIYGDRENAQVKLNTEIKKLKIV